MFDQILQMVQQHMNSNPQVAAAIPDEHAEAIHQEIATHITDGLSSLQNMPASQPMMGGLLSSLENGGNVSGGNPIVGAIEGAVVGALSAKYGLPQSSTGAIAGMLPGLLQKFSQSGATAAPAGESTGGFNPADILSKLQSSGVDTSAITSALSNSGVNTGGIGNELTNPGGNLGNLLSGL